MVSMTSHLGSIVWRFSFSKMTSTPAAFSFRTVWSVSTVLRAKREMDFVKIRSMPPFKARLTMRLNPSRSFVLVPVIPSSAKTETSSQSGLFRIYCS